MAELRDTAGTPFTAPDNIPPVTGTPIVIQTNNGPVNGRLISGEAVANKN